MESLASLCVSKARMEIDRATIAHCMTRLDGQGYGDCTIWMGEMHSRGEPCDQ